MSRQNDPGRFTCPSSSFRMDFTTAIAGAAGGRYDGIGWIFVREPSRNDKQIIGGDLNCCRDPTTGQASEWA